MDPDHPLAALVRKARQERNGAATVAAEPEEVTDPAASTTPAQYTADREYSCFFFFFVEQKTSHLQFMRTPPGLITCRVWYTLFCCLYFFIFISFPLGQVWLLSFVHH